jgi:predicted PurR-regulated permease PerM
MLLTILLLLAILAFLSVSVQSFISAVPSSSRTINKFTTIPRQNTRLNEKIHDQAASGELETVIESVRAHH